MKYLVETTGDFCLYDLNGAQVVQAHRPTVVESTPFIERMAGDRLTKLETLADDASDAALAAARHEDELDEAIEALPRPAKPAAKKPTAKSAD